MKRLTRRDAARRLAYCNDQLLSAEISEERRAILTEKAAIYRRALVGSCSQCGRDLSDPESVALGIGPTCAAHQAVNA